MRTPPTRTSSSCPTRTRISGCPSWAPSSSLPTAFTLIESTRTRLFGSAPHPRVIIPTHQPSLHSQHWLHLRNTGPENSASDSDSVTRLLARKLITESESESDLSVPCRDRIA